MEPIGMSLIATATGHAISFYALSALAIAAALLMVVSRHAVASALWLVLAMVGLAGLFVIQNAFFLAAVQVLVYAGAIMVLFLFVIMLLDLRVEDEEVSLPRVPVVGLAGAVLFPVAMIAVISATHGYFDLEVGDLLARSQAAMAAIGVTNSVSAVGRPIFGEWLLPFEVTSILLLAAIVGAVALTKRKL
jgi:NADH-quinone oxidoreductase subunit J